MKSPLAPIVVSLGCIWTASLASAAALNSPADGATNVDPDNAVLTWTPNANSNGIQDEEAKVFLSLHVAPTSNDVRLHVRSSVTGGVVSGTFSGLRPNTVYYWRVDGLNSVEDADDNPGTARSFTTGPANGQKPVLIYPLPTPTPSPTPRDPDERVSLTPVSGTTGPINNVLKWRTGSLAGKSYNVYLGTHLDKGGPELRGNFYSASGTCTFSPGKLKPNTRFFWKVDLVDSDTATVIREGRMWEFSTGEDPAAGYADPDTALFTDTFENSPTTANPADPADEPYLGWVRKDSSVQTRDSGVVGPRCVKLGGATWISNAVNTEGMKTIRIRFRRHTSANQTLKVEYSVTGTSWTASGTVAAGRNFSETEETFSLPDAVAANQPNLMFRFATSNTSASEYAYIDHVQVLGQAHRYPLAVFTSGTKRMNDAKDRFIFLGDSLTNNTGLPNHWTEVINQRFHLQLNVVNPNITAPERHDNLGKGGSIATKYKGLDPDNDLSTLPDVVPADAQSSGALERLKVELKYRETHGNMPLFVVINLGTNDHKLYGVPAHEGEPVVDPDPSASPPKTSDMVFRDNLWVIVKLVKSVGAQPILVVPHDFYEGPVNGDLNYAVVNDYLDSYYSAFAPRMFGNMAYMTPARYVTPSNDGGALIRFHKFTERIREVAAAEGADLIDVNKAALAYDAVDFTVGGGVHLSDLGHKIYAETIGDYLEDRYGPGLPPP